MPAPGSASPRSAPWTAPRHSGKGRPGLAGGPTGSDRVVEHHPGAPERPRQRLTLTRGRVQAIGVPELHTSTVRLRTDKNDHRTSRPAPPSQSWRTASRACPPAACGRSSPTSSGTTGAPSGCGPTRTSPGRSAGAATHRAAAHRAAEPSRPGHGSAPGRPPRAGLHHRRERRHTGPQPGSASPPRSGAHTGRGRRVTAPDPFRHPPPTSQGAAGSGRGLRSG